MTILGRDADHPATSQTEDALIRVRRIEIEPLVFERHFMQTEEQSGHILLATALIVERLSS